MSDSNVSAVPGRVDAVVCGGGPAGSTVATVLARHGHSVLVLERERFPRFHVGESLLPTNVPLFERIGVLEKVRAAGFQVKLGARFYHQGTERTRFVRFARGVEPGLPSAFQVKRAEFDQLLLDHARSRGATVLEGARVEEVLFDGAGRAAGVRFRADGDAAPREVGASVVFDATGRDALLSRRFGGRVKDPRLDRSALFAHFDRFQRAEGPEGGDIVIVTTPEGWWWLIPFSDGSVSVGTVMPSVRFKERPGSLTDLFEALLAATPEVGRLLSGGSRTTDVHAIADYSYATPRTYGDGFCLLGDAARFLDPVFSTGVLVAMTSGEIQGHAAARALSRKGRVDADDFAPGDGVLSRAVDWFRKYVYGFYSPALLETFYTPAPNAWIERGVTSVLAGAVFQPGLKARALDKVFHACVGLTRVVQAFRGPGEFERAGGLPVAPRET